MHHELADKFTRFNKRPASPNPSSEGEVLDNNQYPYRYE
jgi:hypothetical protein